MKSEIEPKLMPENESNRGDAFPDEKRSNEGEDGNKDLNIESSDSQVGIDTLTQKDAKTIVDSELEKLGNLSKIENTKDQKKLINSHIDGVIAEFDSSAKTQRNFRLMMGKLELLSINPVLEKNVIDRSWNQEQVDKIIKIFEENEKGSEISDGSIYYFPRYGSLFTTGSKRGRENNTISDLFAQSITKRLEEKKVLSYPLQEEIKAWCNNVHMADKDIRMDFLVSVLNNSGKLNDSTVHEAVAYSGLFGSNIIREMENSFNENKKDINKTLRTIEILNFLKNKEREAGFGGAGAEARKVLNKIKEDSDNFFIQAHIEKITSPNRNSDIKRRIAYDEENLRQNYDITVYDAEHGAYNNENIINSSCYSSISRKYGILYNHKGKVDSLFELAGNFGNKNNAKPQKFDLKDVLEKEGFRKENMSDQEYKNLVSTYKTLIELPMREKIEKEFGIELKNFSIREQVQFVNFLSSKTIKGAERVQDFLEQGQNSKTKHNRIKSFLSLESGQKMGDKILNIGEKLDSESADAIFAKYAEIVDLTEKSREELQGLFKERKNISEEEKAKIIQNLINKGGKVLTDFSEKIDKKGKINKSLILNKLEDYKADLILTASVYKGINQESGIKFEDLEGVTFERKTADEILGNEDLIRQMMKIYAENYKDKAKLQKLVLSGLENVLKNQGKNTTFYLYSKGKDLIAFDRFDIMEGAAPRKHFGSFNVESTLQNSKIGRALLEASLNKEAENNEIEADCVPTSPITECYLTERGFAVKKAYTNYEDTGEAIFNIELAPRNKNYHYSGFNKKEIENEHNEKSSVKELVRAEKPFVLKFKSGSEELYNTSVELINKKGYIMSKYFFSTDKKDVFCAFEKA